MYCQLDQALYGDDTFTTVAVDQNFPAIYNDVSKLSRALGIEMRVCKLERTDLEKSLDVMDDESGKGAHNAYAEALMLEIDPLSDNWGKPFVNWDFKGSFILVGEGGEELDLEMSCHLCEYCAQVLRPLFEQSLGKASSRSSVLDQITHEKMLAWNQDRLNDGSPLLEQGM